MAVSTGGGILMDERAHQRPEYLLSPEHACPYLPGKRARTLFLDPASAHPPAYAELLREGFRRSGAYYYRPECAGCQACIPLRIPVNEFAPDRSQRRTWQRNRDLDVRSVPAGYRGEHFALYRRYLAWKHPGAGMDEGSPEDYMSFLMGPEGRTCMVEMRLHDELVAVALMDLADDGLSAVYTFYTPAWPARSFGTFSILWEIFEARRRGLAWLYLGYWIAASPKMAYKNRFCPHEILISRGWQRISRTRR
ncbi:MAG: arginyltransferase [Gammaproteobacteria bacterium]